MKRLVVCCDGTWNKREKGREGTNVSKVADTVAARAGGIEQRVFYDAGVGTGDGLDRIVGGATGRGLGKNVCDAYRFLAENYEPGDEIYLFGFSRGAYTARSVGGMVRKCGLLRDGHRDRVDEAYQIYRSGQHPDDTGPKSFREAHSIETRIRFIGVWDTVGALGIPFGPLRSLFSWRHRFHDVQLSRSVDVACHALAIDERRHAFRPTLWSTTPGASQRVRQAWFAGSHSGVGGGHQRAGLSDVALTWMMREATRAGLAFDEDAVRNLVKPNPHSVLYDSRTGVWKYMPGGWRRMGRPEHQPQALHASVQERRDAPGSKYAPPNLLAYVAAGPSIVGDDDV